MMIAITGATGYIGSRLMVAARNQGHEVLALTRNPPQRQDVSWCRYEIGSSCEVSLPPQTQVVLHLAATTESSDVSIESELGAARQLVSNCLRCGVRFVFVSSQVASETAPTGYGRSKWLIEQEVLAAGGVVVRPGLVYGGEARGLFGRLVQLVSRTPVIPAFWPAPSVQPIHVDDLVRVLLHCASRPMPCGVINCASAVPVPFHDFLRAIAEHRLRVARLFFPVPSLIFRCLAMVVPRGLSHKSGLRRIVSLLDMKPMKPSVVDGYLMKLRPLSEGMQSHCRSRRRDLWGAKSVLQYLGKSSLPVSLAKRYLRAGDAVGGLPYIPSVFLRFPALWAVLDGLVARRIYRNFVEVDIRLSIGVAVLEFSTTGARRMLPCAAESVSAAIAAQRLLLLCMKDVAWSLASILLYPGVRWLLLRSRRRYEKGV